MEPIKKVVCYDFARAAIVVRGKEFGVGMLVAGEDRPRWKSDKQKTRQVNAYLFVYVSLQTTRDQERGTGGPRMQGDECEEMTKGTEKEEGGKEEQKRRETKRRETRGVSKKRIAI